MADLMKFIVGMALGLFFAGIFLPIGITAITDYAGNLSGTNATLWGYLVTFAIIGILLFIIAPALKQAGSLTTGKGRGF